MAGSNGLEGALAIVPPFEVQARPSSLPESVCPNEVTLDPDEFELEGPLEEGVNGAWTLKDKTGKRWIFKPVASEAVRIESREDLGDDVVPYEELKKFPLKRGVRYGTSSQKEVAAYLLDHENFAGVPKTYPARVYLPTSLEGPNPSPDQVAQYTLHAGSLQEYQPHFDSAENIGTSLFSVEQVHKIGVLDVRLLNLDRHSGNILVSEPDYSLHPIDHGFSLPDFRDTSDVSFEWLYWKQCKEKFSARTLGYIKRLDPLKDAEILFRDAALGPEVALSCLLSTTLLKVAAEKGLTLFQIGSILQREGCGDDPSVFERIVSQTLQKMELTGSWDLDTAFKLDNVATLSLQDRSKNLASPDGEVLSLQDRTSGNTLGIVCDSQSETKQNGRWSSDNSSIVVVPAFEPVVEAVVEQSLETEEREATREVSPVMKVVDRSKYMRTRSESDIGKPPRYGEMRKKSENGNDFLRENLVRKTSEISPRTPESRKKSEGNGVPHFVSFGDGHSKASPNASPGDSSPSPSPRAEKPSSGDGKRRNRKKKDRRRNKDSFGSLPYGADFARRSEDEPDPLLSSARPVPDATPSMPPEMPLITVTDMGSWRSQPLLRSRSNGSWGGSKSSSLAPPLPLGRSRSSGSCDTVNIWKDVSKNLFSKLQEIVAEADKPPPRARPAEGSKTWSGPSTTDHVKAPPTSSAKLASAPASPVKPAASPLTAASPATAIPIASATTNSTASSPASNSPPTAALASPATTVPRGVWRSPRVAVAAAAKGVATVASALFGDSSNNDVGKGNDFLPAKKISHGVASSKIPLREPLPSANSDLAKSPSTATSPRGPTEMRKPTVTAMIGEALSQMKSRQTSNNNSSNPHNPSLDRANSSDGAKSSSESSSGSDAMKSPTPPSTRLPTNPFSLPSSPISSPSSSFHLSSPSGRASLPYLDIAEQIGVSPPMSPQHVSMRVCSSPPSSPPPNLPMSPPSSPPVSSPLPSPPSSPFGKTVLQLETSPANQWLQTFLTIFLDLLDEELRPDRKSVV